MKSSRILSISPSVCFAFRSLSLFLCLNHITRLSLCACRLCLLCRYPLAPSHFDKLGHENKPPQCQENAKYRASFLWQCLFNQLPLISALHPLFLSFQNVMEEKSAHRQRLLLSTLLLRPRSVVHSSGVCVSPSISVILLATFLILCRAVSASVSFPYSFLALSLSPPCLSPSCLPVFPFLCISSLSALQLQLSLFFFLLFVSSLCNCLVALIKSITVCAHASGSVV